MGSFLICTPKMSELSNQRKLGKQGEEVEKSMHA
jgi:hypothetical protein